MTGEDNFPTGTEGPVTDQYNSENSSDMFVDPVAEGDFIKLRLLQSIKL